MKARPSYIRDRLRVAMWFALVTGFGEVTLHAFKWFQLRQYLFLGLDVVWMAPLADVIIFGAAAALVLLASRRWPRLLFEQYWIVGSAWLSCVAILYMHSQLHRGAMLLLAAGVAAQFGRLVRRYAVGFRQLLAWSFPVLVVLWSVGFAFARLSPSLSEQRRLGALPAAAPGLPNVLLIVMDVVRAQSLSAYGYGRPTTPFLEAYAKKGVLFERALATAPWTLPSHAGMFTGYPPHALSAGFRQPLDGRHPTLAEVLGARGYATAAFVANGIFAGRETGLDRGFARYDDYMVTVGEAVMNSSLAAFAATRPSLRRLIGWYDVAGRKTADHVNADLLRWLDRDHGSRPFFAFLNYFDAHEPYLPPAPFRGMFGPERARPDFSYWKRGANMRDPEHMSAEDAAAEQAAYDAGIAYIDDRVGKLIAELDRRNLLANTLVIIVSDHGEEFGEHGSFSHANNLYLTTLHVPLVIVFPGRVPAAARVAPFVSLADLPATVTSLLPNPRNDLFPGESLSRYWIAPRPPVEPVTLVSELDPDPRWRRFSGHRFSLTEGSLRYIRSKSGAEEMYDVAADPEERSNLVSAPDHRPRLERFRQSLDRMLRQ